MIVGYLAKLKSIKHGEACVNIERILAGVDMSILGPVFVAILRDMKDTNIRAFYEAMAVFAEEDMDAANEWIREQLSDD